MKFSSVMAFSEPLILLEFGLNSIFAFVSVLILFSFLTRFKGQIPYRQSNVIGFILVSLGLSFHILGHLIIEVILDQSYFDEVIHFIRAFLSLSIMMFILGTAGLAYYNSSEDNKKYFQVFAVVFSITGTLSVLYHFFVWANRDTIDFKVLGQNPRGIDLVFLGIEMISLSVIYSVVYLNSRKTIRPLVSARYRLLSFTALGFVLVILIDVLLELGVLPNQSMIRFGGLLILHLITVGAMYLLVFMPERYKRYTGITPMTA